MQFIYSKNRKGPSPRAKIHIKNIICFRQLHSTPTFYIKLDTLP